MTALLALLRALVALVPLVGPYLVGRAQARQKAKIEGLEADKAANERMSHADISSGGRNEPLPDTFCASLFAAKFSRRYGLVGRN